MNKKSNIISAGIGGFSAGLVNGLLGAGGGMVIVPMLRHCGLDEVKSHATSIAVIFPLCIVSAIMYVYNGNVTIMQALPYLPWILGGSLLGSWLLPHCSSSLLRKIFGILMIWAAMRMMLR